MTAMRDPRFTHKWTDEDIERVATLLRKGLSASQIGYVLNVSRNAVISIVHRSKYLSGIGFMLPSDRPATVIALPRVASPDAKRMAREDATVIPLREPKIDRRPSRQPPPLKIVVNNESAAIREWIAKNGNPRTFAMNERTDEYSVKQFLADRGYKIIGGWQGHSTITGNGVRRSKLRWSGIMAFVDELRVKEGLEPFKRKA